MEGMRRFIAILAADLLERVRSTRFWLAIAAVTAATWWCFPPSEAKYMILGLNGQYRGQYSSAWIGMVLAMTSIWLSLIGFYLVRGTLTRDIETRVWQLLVATPLRRHIYLLAKWCSHLLVLTLIVAAAVVVGVAAQWMRAEDRHIDLLELLKPVLLLQLPGLALTAMFAVWFDLVPWLRRSAGSAVYFVLWLLILASAAPNTLAPDDAATRGLIGDPYGISVFNHAVRQQAAPQIERPLAPGFCLACGVSKKQVRTYDWSTWQVEVSDLPGRLFWLLLSGLGVMLCAPFLDRAASLRTTAQSERSGAAGSCMLWLGIVLKPLQRSPFGTLLASEIQLTLRPRKLWWWLAVLATAAVQAFGPVNGAYIAVILAWMLCLDMYSRSALRECEAGTIPVVFSAARAGKNILLARWTTLVLVSIALTLPAILRFGVASPIAVAAVLVTGISLASWGLALGAATRSSRPFELLVCVLAYVSIDGAPVLHANVDPQFTIFLHLALLPVAAIVLFAMWLRLVRMQFS